MKRTILALALSAVALVGFGCSTWERASFQTLSASKAVIDQAQADYESRAIPRTEAAYATINKAKELQKTAVDGMVLYESIKGTQSTAVAQAQQQIVAAALLQIPAILADVKSLYPSTTLSGQRATPAKPIRMLRWRAAPAYALRYALRYAPART